MVVKSFISCQIKGLQVNYLLHYQIYSFYGVIKKDFTSDFFLLLWSLLPDFVKLTLWGVGLHLFVVVSYEITEEPLAFTFNEFIISKLWKWKCSATLQLRFLLCKLRLTIIHQSCLHSFNDHAWGVKKVKWRKNRRNKNNKKLTLLIITFLWQNRKGCKLIK